MKRWLILNFIILFSKICSAQDVINPYQDLPSSIATYWQLYNINMSNAIEFVRPQYGAALTGEYEIVLDKWFPMFNPINYTLTYSMQTVSFPFTVPCAFNLNGCTGISQTPLTVRNLFMPIAPLIDDRWGDLSNKLLDYTEFPGRPNDTHQTLISKAFIDHYKFFFTPTRRILPHTILKQTINVHCSSPSMALGPVIYTISWYYDNTRGRMRYYPPCTTGCTEVEWDLCFHPEIAKANLHKYNHSISTDILPTGNGTLDYFPYNEIPIQSQCGLITTPTQIQVFNNSSISFNFIYPPRYSLLSAPLRQWRGQFLAGYKDDPFNAGNIIPVGGIQHHYFIDTDFELTDINPIDKVIYNPSDVTITASNLHFPTGYIFKTIRGVYPSVVEVNRDDTPENGGPYTLDQRQVPVITDLRCEDPLFPHDPAVLDDAKYSSLYRLTSGSKLTIDPCVTVYDAAFILNVGSTLDFSNYNSFRGLHRIAIDRNGGRLIRRFVPNNVTQTLYLQNETKPANQPDSYFIQGKIEAGKNVLTTNQGNYIVDANAGLELVASEYIAFKDGFSSKANSNLSARIDNTLSIPQCRIANSGNGNRLAHNTNGTTQNEALPKAQNACKIVIYPTLFSSTITIEFPQSEGIKHLVIMDALGKIAYHSNTDNFNSPIDLSSLKDGIYLVKIENDNCATYAKRIVKNGGY